MDTLFMLACMFLIGCFLFRKKLGILLHSRKKPQELPMKQEALERPEVVTYKVLAFNARDHKDTKEMEDAMELRLEKCLTGLSRQGSRYEVEFHASGYVVVYLVKIWC